MKLASKLAQRLVDLHPVDAAATLETLSAADVASLLRTSRPAVAANVLQSMSPHRAAAVLPHLQQEDLGALLDAMPPDTAASLLRRSDSDFRAQVLEALSGRVGRTLRTLLHYSTDSAATRMDPHVLALPEDLSVEQALVQVREAAQSVLFNLYVVDRQHALVGVLNLRELLSSPPRAPLREVMKKSTFRIAADADRRAILEHPGWREVHSLPVVDSDGRFLGALRYRTLQRLQRDAARSGGDSKETVSALGELFWTGVAGAIDTLTMVGGRGTRRDEEAHGR